MKVRFSRPQRVWLLFALTVAVFAGLNVSPATAGGQSGVASACGDDLFNSLNALGNGAATARGDDAREPELTETVTELPESAKGKGGPKFRVTVPVWFHVVTDGSIGAVTQAQIDEQITVMNLGFAGFESRSGYNTGFSFTLAGVTRTDNAEWFYAGPTTSGERAMKRALKVGGADTLNYYSTTAGPYLGWAYFPGLSPGQEYLDGIVVDWESMVKTSTRYAGQYDLGKTATHEAGHWVGLHHVFNGGCNNWGDYVDDTPRQLTATRGCPEGQDSCTKYPGIDSIHNYMDYSYDSCYWEFTAGQAARAQDHWLHFRA